VVTITITTTIISLKMKKKKKKFYFAKQISEMLYVQIQTDTTQEAQLPQRNSASAAHMEGGWG